MRTSLIEFLAVVFLLPIAVAVEAQDQPSAAPSEPQMATTLRQMREEIQQLRQAVAELRAEAQEYRNETLQLRRDLQVVGTRGSAAEQQVTPGTEPSQAQAGALDGTPSPAPQAATSSERLSRLEEQYQLLTGKVDDQFQTKVESASKYRVRLSGILLLNLFSNRGAVDNIDFPGLAEPASLLSSGGSFGGTLRQSQIGLELFGPDWAGAKVSADLHFDFAGGFPDTHNGVTLGLARFRTGSVRLAWRHTVVVAGQETPLFSPLSPTSLASLAEPAFSDAGNLWTWAPQLRVEHQIDLRDGNSLAFQLGVLDALTGESPKAQSERMAGPGEASRQPGYAARFAFSRGEEDQQLVFGAGGYFSRQNWSFGRNVNSWAATADWTIPIHRRFELRGEFYRGRALGGLGGATYHSIVSNDVVANPNAIIRGLDTMGGWAQLKFRASSTLEFNTAYGQDNPFSGELRSFESAQRGLDPQIGRNQSALLNLIYRPRSNLVFSTEYRHLQSLGLRSDRGSAEHLNMSIGVLF